MRTSGRQGIYNSRISQKLHRRSSWHRSWALAALSLLGTFAGASEWQAPAEQLARKIAAVTGPGAVSLSVDNHSSLTRASSDEVRRQLITQLGGLGVHFVEADQAAAIVQVTLSENRQSYVWVAEIRQGAGEPSVVMTSTPRLTGPDAGRAQPPLVIKKTLLWSDANRILDVALVNGNPQHMILLEAEAVVLYRQQGGRWQLDQSLPIVHLKPWPRDLRGRLLLEKDHLFDAYLPGVFCRSSNAAPLAIGCRPSDDPWPLATEPFHLNGFFASSRNFFTGVLSPGVQKQTAVAAFYSAAPLPRDKYTVWIFATVDGQVHLLDGVTDQTVGKLGWGSDLAGVKSNCGSGWQILASSNGDGPGEAVKAFEFPDREPVAVSLPVEFNGNITALWTQSDGNGAIAVSQNQESGVYEANLLSIACSQ
jgi:hypothetical protein